MNSWKWVPEKDHEGYKGYTTYHEETVRFANKKQIVAPEIDTIKELIRSVAQIGMCRTALFANAGDKRDPLVNRDLRATLYS